MLEPIYKIFIFLQNISSLKNQPFLSTTNWDIWVFLTPVFSFGKRPGSLRVKGLTTEAFYKFENTPAPSPFLLKKEKTTFAFHMRKYSQRQRKIIQSQLVLFVSRCTLIWYGLILIYLVLEVKLLLLLEVVVELLLLKFKLLLSLEFINNVVVGNTVIY